jgi:acetyl esterase/lipase
MDIHVPKSVNGQAPTVIYIHGGAWRGGLKKGAMSACDTLYHKGFVVIGINYRLSGDSIFPPQLYSCKAAFTFLKRNTATYRINTSRIGIIGFSAESHLATLLGTSQNVANLEGLHLGSRGVSSRVHAVMDVFGPNDFLQMNAHIPPACKNPQQHNAPDSSESQLIGCPIQTCPDQVARANPITYISSNEQPFAIHHGLADCIVPAHQVQLFYDTLKKKGVDVTIGLYARVGHGGPYWAPFNQAQTKHKKRTSLLNGLGALSKR